MTYARLYLIRNFGTVRRARSFLHRQLEHRPAVAAAAENGRAVERARAIHDYAPTGTACVAAPGEGVQRA